MDKPKPPATIVTSIKLDAKLYTQLRQRALAERRPARLLIEDAIKAYLRKGR